MENLSTLYLNSLMSNIINFSETVNFGKQRLSIDQKTNKVLDNGVESTTITPAFIDEGGTPKFIGFKDNKNNLFIDLRGKGEKIVTVDSI